jgi:hypothetical protein
MKAKKPVIPQKSYWQLKDWKYVPACSTNVLARFKSIGWRAPSEVKK